MTLSTILLVVLILLLVGMLPAWPHAAGFGWGPSGVVVVLLIVLLVLMLTGRV